MFAEFIHGWSVVVWRVWVLWGRGRSWWAIVFWWATGCMEVRGAVVDDVVGVVVVNLCL